MRRHRSAVNKAASEIRRNRQIGAFFDGLRLAACLLPGRLSVRRLGEPNRARRRRLSGLGDGRKNLDSITGQDQRRRADDGG